jgi:dipeptidyl aminopeptidase/acylaminoacyl peptidase
VTRILATIGGLTAVVALTLYGVFSYLLFDAVTTVDARCGFFEDGTPRFADYTPAAFGTAGLDADLIAPGLDVDAYAMPGYEEVALASRDGVDLVAWWVPGATPDAPAVILAHGAGGCRRDPVILLPAGMLHRNGYAVLIVDLRDQGDSRVLDGRFSGGTQEYLDVLGAWDWLRARGLPAGRIGLLGGSNGAATVVIAAGEEPGVAAVWEDSGYADTATAIAEEVRRHGYPEFLTVGGRLWALLAGIDADAHRPIDAMALLGARPIAIVHGLHDDRVEPHHALDFVRALQEARGEAGRAVEPWLVPGAEHVQAAFVDPPEYERRLVTFFGEAIGLPGID